MSRTRTLTITLTCLAWASQALAACDYYVHPWHPSADWHTIQDALDNAPELSTVCLDDRVWSGAGNTDLNFNGKKIFLKSESGDPTLCSIDCADSGRAFTFDSGETNLSWVEGIRITDGNESIGGAVHCSNESSPYFLNCQFVSCAAGSGGAVAVLGASGPTFLGCDFLSNSASSAGGSAYITYQTSPRFVNCFFDGSTAPNGGAVKFTNGSSAEFDNCTIQTSTATGDGGAFHMFNGANAQITDCDFFTNIAGGNGGAIYTENASPTIDNGYFVGNQAYKGATAYHLSSTPTYLNSTLALGVATQAAGAVYNDLSDSGFTNCIFSTNDGGNYGGALRNRDSTPVFTSCLFNDNTVNIDGGAMYNSGSTVEIDGGIIRDNRASDDGGAIASINSSTTIRNATFDDNDATDEGGAVSDWQGTTTIENCTITQGDARNGGAVRVAQSSTLIVSGGSFTDNDATERGGAIYSDDSSLTLTDLTLEGNLAELDGGAVHAQQSTPSFENVTFDDNWAGNDGGGYSGDDNAPGTMERCTFFSNHAVEDGAGVRNLSGDLLITETTFISNEAKYGGGLSVFDDETALINCLLASNTATQHGGAMYIANGGLASLAQCTVADNSALFGMGGGLLLGSPAAAASLANSIVWSNSDSTGTGESAQLFAGGAPSAYSVHYTCIDGWSGTYTGTGNTGADPMFVAAGSGNYHLDTGSSAIDTGDDAAIPAGVTIDLDLGPRRLDGDGDGTVVVDMGAYEHETVSSGADTDGDGDVDFADLVSVLSAWGSCSGCPEDIDGDGTVGFTDLLAVLAGWSA